MLRGRGGARKTLREGRGSPPLGAQLFSIQAGELAGSGRKGGTHTTHAPHYNFRTACFPRAAPPLGKSVCAAASVGRGGTEVISSAVSPECPNGVIAPAVPEERSICPCFCCHFLFFRGSLRLPVSSVSARSHLSPSLPPAFPPPPLTLSAGREIIQRFISRGRLPARDRGSQGKPGLQLPLPPPSPKPTGRPFSGAAGPASRCDGCWRAGGWGPGRTLGCGQREEGAGGRRAPPGQNGGGERGGQF